MDKKLLIEQLSSAVDFLDHKVNTATNVDDIYKYRSELSAVCLQLARLIKQ